jgi:hypothetical protein
MINIKNLQSLKSPHDWNFYTGKQIKEKMEKG